MNDNFCPSHTVVELDTWERGPVFRHFIDDLRIWHPGIFGCRSPGSAP